MQGCRHLFRLGYLNKYGEVFRTALFLTGGLLLLDVGLFEREEGNQGPVASFRHFRLRLRRLIPVGRASFFLPGRRPSCIYRK